MEKIKKLLTIGLAVLLLFCIRVSLAGCKKGWHADGHKFLYERMNEIQIEYSGYSLEENNTDYMIQHKGGEYTYQGEKLSKEKEEVLYVAPNNGSRRFGSNSKRFTIHG